MMTSNTLLIRYLEAVVADDPDRPDDKAAGVPHSDRHLALLAHLRTAAGVDAADDRQRLREAVVVEAERRRALDRVLRILAGAGIQSLVLKGAAYSHTVYPAPYLRARNDDDLWVRASDFPQACAVLEASGYRAHVELTSPAITRQRHFEAMCGALLHQVDLHWWPVNSSAFDSLPDFDACLDSAVPLTAVGAQARAPDPVHALVLACAHRVAHHTPTEDAMWLCDVHLLAEALDGGQWPGVEAVAHHARVARLCGTELARAREVLGTRVPPDSIERLLAVTGEPSARYLRPLGPLRDLWYELVAAHGVRARARLLAHHLLPPREYVAERYGYRGILLLPFLYAHRAVTGLTRWTTELVVRLTR